MLGALRPAITDSTGVLVVYVTAPVSSAADLAKALVGKRLAACVNLIPSVRSIYHWEGAIQDEAEALLIIKTTAAGYDALRDEVLALHPYSVPEVIALPVVTGSAPYCAWVHQSVLSGDGGAAR